MSRTTEVRPATSASDPVLTTVRVLSVLTVLNLLVQFVTAGTLVNRGGGDALEPVHSAGAIVLHVLAGLTTIAAFALWRMRGAALWPAVTALVVFVLSFVQAYYGGRSTLYIHVPGAMILTIGAVAVMVWSFTAAARGSLGRGGRPGEAFGS